MVKPKLSKESAVRIHAINVRSAAMRVRVAARLVGVCADRVGGCGCVVANAASVQDWDVWQRTGSVCRDQRRLAAPQWSMLASSAPGGERGAARSAPALT